MSVIVRLLSCGIISKNLDPATIDIHTGEILSNNSHSNSNQTSRNNTNLTSNSINPITTSKKAIDLNYNRLISPLSRLNSRRNSKNLSVAKVNRRKISTSDSQNLNIYRPTYIDDQILNSSEHSNSNHDRYSSHHGDNATISRSQNKNVIATDQFEPSANTLELPSSANQANSASSNRSIANSFISNNDLHAESNYNVDLVFDYNVNIPTSPVGYS